MACGRSPLLMTVICLVIGNIWVSNGSGTGFDPSTISSTKSASIICCRVRSTPARSTASELSRSPAVSMRRTDSPDQLA